MIVPEIAASAAAELDDLRAACDVAVAGLVASGADTLLVVGSGRSDRTYHQPFRGSFRPWNVPLHVYVGDPVADGAAGGADDGVVPAGSDPLPLSLLVGGWLLQRTLGRADIAGPVDAPGPNAPIGIAPGPNAPIGIRMATVRADGPTGGDGGGAVTGLAADHPWALLVMGDGSACRGVRAPGYDDPRAEAYDDAVAAALAGADAPALLGLDPELSAELMVAGRAPWQVLANAAKAAGGRWRGELSYYAAPYGVAYFVASWTPA